MVLAAVLAALAAWLVCTILEDPSAQAPAWACTAVWVVAIIFWITWAFSGLLRR